MFFAGTSGAAARRSQARKRVCNSAQQRSSSGTGELSRQAACCTFSLGQENRYEYPYCRGELADSATAARKENKRSDGGNNLYDTS
ncbi:hypothetical protein B0T21DRAFT_406405 [Apiosordaria backusii]|uniref:Uncharacterized protein n=1 Tax=Apiosordaria backusii TaxID=314023 RepID=A0AA40K753_9PEZI|nr:hypothetical protein B0T21DRAFT_406405 [Apiosordaria backusii]